MRKLLLVLFFIIVTSCSTKVIEVPVETVRTEYINTSKIDSVYIKDSTDRVLLGDTLYITKYYTKYKYVTKCDTIIKKDTIPLIITVNKIKEVNILYWWLSALMWLGGVILICIIAYIIYKLK